MAIDAATRIEKANYDGGVEEAYKAFTKEVEQITASSSPADADQKIIELTGALEKNGMLPGLETYWVGQQDTLFGGDDKFDRAELNDYVEGRKHDKVAFALGTAFKADYSRIKGNFDTPGIDFFGDREKIGVGDLIFELQLAAAKRDIHRRKDVATKFADELKSDPKLFDQLKGLDGNDGSLSWVDIDNARKSFDLNDKMGQQVLSEKQIHLIKNVDWDTFKGLSGTWFDITQDDLKKMPAYRKNSWELEPSSEEVAKSEAQKDAAGSEDGGKAKGKSDGTGIIEELVENLGKAAGAVLGASAGKKLGEDYAPTLMKEGSLPPEDHIYKYEIQAGQGFDRIARDILRREAANAKEGQKRQYDERDVIALSEAIAKFNGMKRNDMLRLDQGVLNIPPLDWTAAK